MVCTVFSRHHLEGHHHTVCCTIGRGHPKRVPQEFKDSFHSTREDQSDMMMDSNSETEEEELDDINTYDTETSRCTTVAERDHHIARDHRRTNKQRVPGKAPRIWQD